MKIELNKWQLRCLLFALSDYVDTYPEKATKHDLNSLYEQLTDVYEVARTETVNVALEIKNEN